MAGEKTIYDAGATLPEIAEEVSSGLGFITRSVSPLLVAIGVPDAMKPVFNVKHEWMEEKLLANSTTADGAHNNSTTTINVATGTGTRFRAGDLIQVDGSREIMSIDSGGVAANALTVTRSFGGTTAEAFSDGDTIYRIANPSLEIETTRNPRNVNRTRQTNYTQIFQETAGVSRTDRLADQLGDIEDELAHQVMLVKRDLLRDYAYSLINGDVQASNPEGNDSTARTMKGIINWILDGSDAALVDASSGPLTETLLNNALREAYTRGGKPDMIVASAEQKRALSALAEGRVRYDSGTVAAGVVVDQFHSDFGIMDILEPDIFVPKDTLLILDSAKLTPVMLGEEGDPFEEQPIGKDGTTDKTLVIGELGLEIHNAGDGGHAMIHNLT